MAENEFFQVCRACEDTRTLLLKLSMVENQQVRIQRSKDPGETESRFPPARASSLVVACAACKDAGYVLTPAGFILAALIGTWLAEMKDDANKIDF